MRLAFRMDLREVFAANLRRMRHECGLSQEQLAHDAKINRTYISKLETGATYAGLEIIGRLASVMKIEPADLLKLPPKRSRRK